MSSLIIIGVSGEIGVGKSTVAQGIAAALTRRKHNVVVLSFGDEVKKEAAALYGFDVALGYTADGKRETVMVEGQERTVRWCLQYHGQLRRQEDPLYWDKKAMKTATEATAEGANVIIFDDVRHLSEVASIKSAPHNMIFRLLPYPGLHIDPAIASHVSERELDAFNLKEYTRVFAPLFGKLDCVVLECVEKIATYLRHVIMVPEAATAVTQPLGFDSVAEAIAFFQNRDNITRNGISRHLGIKQRDFLPIENGEELPTMEQATALAALFAAPESYFITGYAEE